MSVDPIRKPLPDEWFVDYGNNAEMRWDSSDSDEPLTPTERFFVRNHVRTPVIDPASYRLKVYGAGLAGAPTQDAPVSFSLDDLLALPRRTCTCILECTGNGRALFESQQHQQVRGTPWTLGGVGQASWTGVSMADVLDRAGVLDSAVDVMATGLDDSYRLDGVDHGPVRRPLPIAKALDDTLLAFAMNDEPLPPDHGFPVRLVVPGWVGVASIKWLGGLEVSTSRLYSPWNTLWYRMRGGDYPPDSEPLEELPVKSIFELPWPATVTAGLASVLRGRSWSGAGAIRSVEVSVDGGKRWQPATLVDRPTRHQWVRWRLSWTPPRAGDVELLARACDTAGRSQPDTVPYNPNGYLFWAAVRHPATVLAG